MGTGSIATEANKAVERRLIEEVLNGGRLELLEELYAPKLAAATRRWITPFRAAFPDLRMEVVDLIAEGDQVVGRFACSGTHQGTWRGHPPTGRRFERVAEVSIFRLHQGRIVHAWVWKTPSAACGSSAWHRTPGRPPRTGHTRPLSCRWPRAMLERMNRRRLAWLVSSALAVGGSFAAHALGLLPATAEGREHLTGGPEPLPQVPLLLGLVAAVALTSLANRTWRALQRAPRQPLSPGWFLTVPPLGWTLQEAAERLLHVESFPFHAALEPAFLAGLAVQALVGAAAFALTRVLLARIQQLRRARQAAGWPRADQSTIGITMAGAIAVRPRQLALALVDYERGPPARP
jgi:hypothetical protein